jgi:hypothetical protein
VNSLSPENAFYLTLILEEYFHWIYDSGLAIFFFLTFKDFILLASMTCDRNQP